MSVFLYKVWMKNRRKLFFCLEIIQTLKSIKVALSPDSFCLPLLRHTNTHLCMNTVNYTNYKKYLAQNNPALDFFVHV